MIACVTRPQNFTARPYHGSIHPHKISDRYDSPNPFKNAVASERASDTYDLNCADFHLIERKI
jgi:hypothetical protein